MKRCPTCESNYPSRFSVCPQDGSKLIETSGWAEGNVIRGKYRILSKVGQGGMGAVYKASHVTFEELRAIKVMNPELLGDALFVKRFKQEAVIARKLDHPNAVRVDDIDESEDGLPFMVMEFIEGRSLKDLIEQQGPLPAQRVCSIIQQVASALNAAHGLGMVHRDIKPANIVLIQTPNGEQAKVLDFGIAKIKESRSGDSGMTLTGTGIVIGTPQYMSPEQALGKRGDQLDGRSDLYSLGVVMYQMLTGELPFKTDTTMQLLLAHINTPPRPVLEAKPALNIPPALALVVMRCLEKDPAARPQTGDALIQEIAAARTGDGGPTTREGPAEEGATMIASPAMLAETAATYAGRAKQAAAGPSYAATATATPPSLEAPPAVAVPAPAAAKPHGSRAGLIAVVVLIVAAVAGGAVWAGFHFGYIGGQHQAATPAPAATTSQAGPPSATPSPGAVASTQTNQTNLAGQTSQPPQTPETTAAPAPMSPPGESKPSSTKTPSIRNLAAHNESQAFKLSQTKQGQAAAGLGQQASSGTTPERREVARSGPPPASFNPTLATVVVTTAPGAQIYIDGKMAGTAGSSGQLTVQDLKAGVHSLRASLTGFNDIDSNFNLPPGGTGFLNAKWGASQSTAAAPAAASQSAPLTSSTAPTARRASPVAASYQVEYLHRLGSAKGLLAIEGGTVRYQPSNGKDAFTSPIAGISWGASGGNEFFIRLANGRTVKFRSASSATILSTLHRAASGT